MASNKSGMDISALKERLKKDGASKSGTSTAVPFSSPPSLGTIPSSSGPATPSVSRPSSSPSLPPTHSGLGGLGGVGLSTPGMAPNLGSGPSQPPTFTPSTPSPTPPATVEEPEEPEEEIAYDYTPPPETIDPNAYDPSVKVPESKSKLISTIAAGVIIAALAFFMGNMFTSASIARKDVNARIAIAKQMLETMKAKGKALEQFYGSLKKAAQTAEIKDQSKKNEKDEKEALLNYKPEVFELLKSYLTKFEDPKASFVLNMGNLSQDTLRLSATDDPSSAAFSRILEYARTTMLLQSLIQNHLWLTSYDKSELDKLKKGEMKELQVMYKRYLIGKEDYEKEKAENPNAIAPTVYFAVIPIPNMPAGTLLVEVKKVYIPNLDVQTGNAPKTEYENILSKEIENTGDDRKDRKEKLKKILENYHKIRKGEVKQVDLKPEEVPGPIQELADAERTLPNGSTFTAPKYLVYPVDDIIVLSREQIFGIETTNAWNRYRYRMQLIVDLLEKAANAKAEAIKHLEKQASEEGY